MGRSKFPGKPSKHVNRTRINVLAPTSGSSIGETKLPIIDKTNRDLKQNVVVNGTTKEDSDPQTARRISKKKRSSKCLRNRRASRRTGIIANTSKTVKNKINGLKHVASRCARTKANVRRQVHGLTLCQLTKPKQSPQKEQSNLVGKFVLPSRSVHSSRVIKPNKRFINVEPVSHIEVRTFKRRVKKSLSIKEEDKPKTKCANDTENETENNMSVGDAVVRTPNRRIVLRQARLQLHSQTPSGPEGPFSSSSSSSGSPPGTVTCGVCGAVRFYRFVKQARKFNIYSCESCRKFISKMIKRQSCGKNLTAPTLVCHKGQGMCHVPPIVRSQQWKLIRCAYRARCPACWLKMCLRSFQMPMALKNNLVRLLPQNMRSLDVLFSNSLPLLSWQSNVENKSAAATNKASNCTGNEPKDLSVSQRPSRVKHKANKSNVVVADVKRQKVDLRGPRVKHVCRSASVVLGKPIATFPTDSDKKKSEIFDAQSKINKIESPIFETEAFKTLRNNFVDTTNDIKNEEIEYDIKTKNSQHKIEPPKKDRIAKPSSFFESKLHKKNLDIQKNTISIDFWESYDPEEVCRSGFGLMSSEPFPMQAICFLCGSAGREPLLHCSLCCEPYHSFCLEQEPTNIGNASQSFSWLCPRCTICSACGQPDKQKLNCQKCHKAYHPECFNTKWQTDDRPTVCSTCLRCKSCGTDNITKFVGNLPLCLACFKLRKKGNYCPLCQRCYEDNDFDTKMMECGKCRKWIHAKCEGLYDEQYQMLSLLPESVEFLCCLCSNQSTPYWRKAVESELRASFNNVLRMLSKNRVARNILKWSPLSGNISSTKFIGTARKLQFNDSEQNSEISGADIDTLDDVKNETIKTKLNFKDTDTDDKNQSAFNEIEINSKLPHTPSMIDIKNKLNSNEYCSLKEFNEKMENVLDSTRSEELLQIYRSVLKNVFPWYDPTQTSDTNLNLSHCDVSRVETENLEMHPINIVQQNNQKEALGNDSRTCALCKFVGDGMSQQEARLLYCGHNEWVHSNCALWSSEVYEEIDGSLQNVHSALSRGRLMRCAYCKQKGASVGCCAKGCFETYHFSCARSMNCYFMHDKTVFCSSHETPPSGMVISSLADFDIHRSIYVELDRKKKKYVEPEKVHFMVGSLSVTNLGKIIPFLSDTPEAIIPSGFTCSRLFWSTIEPWKLVPYVISTSVLNAQLSNIIADKNFTVDHSLPKAAVERKLREILIWQKDMDKSELLEFDDEEEPQNAAADILSPELTDAILEELPHDLLDGISVQDIFPKFMSYEELLDLRTSELINTTNDCTKTDPEVNKKVDDEIYECNTPIKNGRELIRSKSEVFSQLGSADKYSKARSQQRSCSLTWSCKLDSSLSPVIKKRKIAPCENNVFFQLLQVDGACDTSSGSECGSPVHEIEDFWSPQLSEEPVKCERCQCTYRTQASYKRHLETCEVMSTSDSDSEIAQEHESTLQSNVESTPIMVNVNGSSEPFVVASYESLCTYQTTKNEVQSTILNTHTFVSSESTSEVMSVPKDQGLYYSNFQQSVPQSVPTQITTELNHQSNEPSFCMNQTNTPLCVTQSTPLPINQSNSISLVQTNALPINQTGTLNNQSTKTQPQVTIRSLPLTQEVAPVLNINPQNQITIDSKMLAGTCSSIINIPQNQWVKSIIKPTVNQKPIRTRGRPKSQSNKRNQISNGTLMLPSSNVSNPSVIMQHLPSANIVPTFVDSFQQQNGQNLQYIATISPHITTTIQPPIMQLQPDNSFISLVPSMQPTILIQQPRVDQLIVDGSGSVVWASQPVQPVYYGFETIVQNTVMQSQQFLPTAVPGVLTANSSYSTTTQVFQTSKLEPVLDVSSGSFVLVNSGQLVNPQVQVSSVPQLPTNISSQPTLSQTTPLENKTWRYIEPNTAVPSQKAAAVVSSSINNSINLPVAPFVSEQGIPTNVVTPTPKIPTSTQSRPMSRVLPMQTNTAREIKKAALFIEKTLSPQIDSPIILHKLLDTEEKIKKINVIEDVIIKPASEKCEKPQLSDSHIENSSFKLIVQKQNEESRKLNNGLIAKNCTSVQIAPLKPVKPRPIVAQNNFNTPIVNKNDNVNKEISFKNERKLHPEKIENNSNGSILYTVENQDGFRFTSTSIIELWTKVFDAVQAARTAHNMNPLPSNALNMINNLQLLGLKANGLRYLLEQLPGAGKCIKYKPNFHISPVQSESDDDIIEHIHGAIRCAPYSKRNESNDMFGWLASKHRKPENNLSDSELITRRGSITNLPMAMRFRQLKLTSKISVGVYRSGIHRRGLFCLRDIESGEMVIEYAGEVIRSALTDKREKYYNSKGIGCYMFRIDDNLVVDATMKGNAARFINHSCDPNCYSKVVEILGHKHIIIFALRKILCGEELTYDYKFPFEEDKIPCTCGARRCRKFLN